MNIEIINTKGARQSVSEMELFRAVISYLRLHSPDRVKIIAEETSNSGMPEIVPAAVIMLLKNPEEVVFYTDTVPFENSENKKP